MPTKRHAKQPDTKKGKRQYATGVSNRNNGGLKGKPSNRSRSKSSKTVPGTTTKKLHLDGNGGNNGFCPHCHPLPTKKYQIKLTPAARERAIGALMNGADMAGAAEAAGVRRQTLYECFTRERKRDEPGSFEMRCYDAQEIPKNNVKKNLYRAACAIPLEPGSITAMIFYLKNKCPDEFKDKHEFDHTHRERKFTATIGEDSLIEHQVETKGAVH